MLSVDNINLKITTNNYFENLTTDQRHYMRFLYRLYKFSEQFETWFTINREMKEEINLFIENFIKTEKVNNIPLQDSDYNEKKGLEHILEKAFSNFPEIRSKIKIDYSLYDQLPNGLFTKNIKKSNQIFNTGYFDLWGVNPGNTLNIFELKEPTNTKIGIISELYFYANYAYDLINENLNIRKSDPCNNKDFRDYSKLINSKVKNVVAYFLVSKFHTRIQEKIQYIIDLLNQNSNICYNFLYYNIDSNELNLIKKKLSIMYKKKDN